MMDHVENNTARELPDEKAALRVAGRAPGDRSATDPMRDFLARSAARRDQQTQEPERYIGSWFDPDPAAITALPEGRHPGTRYLELTRASHREHKRSDLRCALAVVKGEDRRDAAMVAVFVTTGLRVSELVRLDLSHWDRVNEVLTLVMTKSGRDHAVPVDSRTKAYLQVRDRAMVYLLASTGAVTFISGTPIYLGREGFGREDIDGHAEEDEQLVTNGADVKERRLGGRVDEEVEVAFARVVAARGRAEHPRIRCVVA